MFHATVIGAKTGNLDGFFTGPERLRYLLARESAGMDISILEGVMGYYDGIAATSQASSYAVAAATGTPAVLVVPAKGMGLSVAAVVEGYCRFQPDSHIRGVILNRISPALYQELKVQIEARCGIRVFGYLPEEPELTLASRHLGLLLPEEVAGLREKLQRLAARLEETLDLEGLLTLAGSAPGLASSGPDLTPGEPVRLAVAKDEAFCFYYRENLELLQDPGGGAGSLFSFAGPEAPGGSLRSSPGRRLSGAPRGGFGGKPSSKRRNPERRRTRPTHRGRVRRLPVSSDGSGGSGGRPAFHGGGAAREGLVHRKAPPVWLPHPEGPAGESVWPCRDGASGA